MKKHLQKYKYNGKEMDRMYGLDTYDHGARQYNPARITWDRMDPLAEKYYHINPYLYCAGNPISYVDPEEKYQKPSFFDKLKATVSSAVDTVKSAISNVNNTVKSVTSAISNSKVIKEVKSILTEATTKVSRATAESISNNMEMGWGCIYLTSN